MKESEKLLQEYISGEATPEQKAIVEKWYDELSVADQSGFTDLQKEEQLAYIRQNLPGYGVRKVNLWLRVVAAAAVVLVVGAGLFFYTSRHLEGSAATGDLVNDIKPGGNKAYLTLANGKRISLTDAANGQVASDNGVEVRKTGDGRLVYGRSLPGVEMTGTNEMRGTNTIETPRGGQYQVVLPDGSKVWLNAASKLVYPISFNGHGKREVSLEGEAYFEITKDKLHPFRVKSDKQVVEVLGTHFNINSYADEPSIQTTLLEGSVAVRYLDDRTEVSLQHSLRDDGQVPDMIVLKPGEQAVLRGNTIKVQPADEEEALAWKNNMFVFNDEPLQSIMRKIERWYDVDVVYEGIDKNQSFLGSQTKYTNVSSVLKNLSMTGRVNFRIEGKKIFVIKGSTK